uniref:Gypsy retrotransposon integrase-like protein 1 n=1 Tax=Phallusia mammillata TaxID=59560 RepID=A0A6F9DI50_9ASCI|nr:uncharacterized protein LOC104265615 [Phallusia mammillata]
MMTSAKRSFDELLAKGIVEHSNSCWSSPLHMVRKKDNSWRVVGDYRQLNLNTVKDKYSMPYLQDFGNNLHGCTIFSTIDLLSAYHQIPMHPDSIGKTTIATPFGNFAYKRMSFGLCNAGQTFQRFINQVVRGLDKFCFAYMDDLLIASKSQEEHIEHLRQVFQRLQSYGLLINKGKSVFGKSEVTFLGHCLTPSGFKPIEARVRAIREYPRPTNVNELRRFLGMYNFYRKFVPHAAESLQHLNGMLSGNKTKKQKLEWEPHLIAAFEDAKTKLSDKTLLTYPKHNARLSLICDSSSYAVGACLNQFENNEWKPLGFFSKPLSGAEKRYSTFDRELLAIYKAIKHFKYILQAREFKVITDHKPLISAFRSVSENQSPRQIRHFDFIAQFTDQIEYITGIHNVVADSLSRVEVNTITLPSNTFSLEELAIEQQNESFLSEVNEQCISLKVVHRLVPDTEVTIIGDISTGSFRPIVPRKLRKKVFLALHGLAHPGFKGTKQLISERFVWHGMKNDVQDWCKSCIPCQKSKVTIHNRAPLGRYLEPEGRFTDLSIDIVGPLPACNGYSYLLTVVCRWTRWFTAIPLNDITASTCADAFILNWISIFGCPLRISTDRGAQFTSSLWSDLCNMLGAKLQQTTAYHPASNGYIERQHRTLKAALRAHEYPNDWYSNLGLILLSLRATVKSDISCSPAELVLGNTLRLPGEFFEEPIPGISKVEYAQRLSKFISNMKFIPPRINPPIRSHLDPELKKCSHVFVKVAANKGPLYSHYDGPFKVIERHDKYYVLAMWGRTNSVSIDRLKVCYLPSEINVTTNSNDPLICPDIIEGRSEGSETAATPDIEVDRTPESSTTAPTPPSPIIKTRTGRVVRRPLRFRD